MRVSISDRSVLLVCRLSNNDLAFANASVAGLMYSNSLANYYIVLCYECEGLSAVRFYRILILYPKSIGINYDLDDLALVFGISNLLTIN